ncbi:hypothetical protein ACFUMH_13105 [Cellulomonas sp. NPDC057328]|uniref:hypothetical protein n=1 Tax=Cellulomonas sp. NPDC057328 TaxID=3346101 RepID=UPI0036266855
MRRRPVVRTVPAAVLLAAVTALGACSDGDSYAVRDAQPCPVAEQLGTSLDLLTETFTDDSTPGDVAEARARVEGAQDRIDDAAEEIAPQEADALEDAWERLDEQLAGLEGRSVAGSADALTAAADEVATARDQLAEALSC